MSSSMLPQDGATPVDEVKIGEDLDLTRDIVDRVDKDQDDIDEREARKQQVGERAAAISDENRADTRPRYKSGDSKHWMAVMTALQFSIQINERGHRREVRRASTDSKTGLDEGWYLDALGNSVNRPADGWIACGDKVTSLIRAEIREKFRGASYHAGDLRYNPENFHDFFLVNADYRDPFNDWLCDLPAWDGKPRLERLMIDCWGADDTPLNRWVGKGFLTGAVRRAHIAPALHDWMPILIGEQGIGKSYGVKLLLPESHASEWHCDDVQFDQPTKKQVEQSQGAVIVEYSEMTGLSRAMLEKVKAHISRDKDKCRLAYGRTPATIHRRWVGIGTANDSGLGTIPYDESGSRRFIAVPVSTSRARVERYLTDNRNQLWAEAMAVWGEGENANRIPDFLKASQDSVNLQHTAISEAPENAAGNATSAYAGTGTLVQIIDLMVQFRLADTEVDASKDFATQRAFGKALRSLSWTRAITTLDGKRGAFWTPPVAAGPTCRTCGKPKENAEWVECNACADALPLVSGGHCGLADWTEKAFKQKKDGTIETKVPATLKPAYERVVAKIGPFIVPATTSFKKFMKAYMLNVVKPAAHQSTNNLGAWIAVHKEDTPTYQDLIDANWERLFTDYLMVALSNFIEHFGGAAVVTKEEQTTPQLPGMNGKGN